MVVPRWDWLVFLVTSLLLSLADVRTRQNRTCPGPGDGQWGDWSPCTPTCGNGSKTRWRRDLEGDLEQTRPCSGPPCQNTGQNLDTDDILEKKLGWITLYVVTILLGVLGNLLFIISSLRRQRERTSQQYLLVNLSLRKDKKETSQKYPSF